MVLASCPEDECQVSVAATTRRESSRHKSVKSGSVRQSASELCENSRCRLPKANWRWCFPVWRQRLGVAEAIRAQHPEARELVLTTYYGDEDAYRSLKAGAQGYLLKDTPREAELGQERTQRVDDGPSVLRFEVAARGMLPTRQALSCHLP